MIKIQSKMKALECSQHFSHYKSMEIFSRLSRAANSVDPGQILPNFKPIQAFISVLVTCKNEEDYIQSKMKVLSAHNIIHSIFKRSRAANSVVGDGIWQKFNLIQAFMVVLVTCKKTKIQSKMKPLECSQHFSHYKSMESFSDFQG